MAWIELFIAGIFEVVWSTCMKYSHGFTNLKFTFFTFAGMAVSVYFLAQAIKALPMGTAYAIWTGIGALGAVVVGIILFKEPATASRLFFAALLVAGIVGLKFSSGH
ncbi:multidrug efflux SMR transporter [Cloacibacillus sp. An23]|uniref:DMT family transporter n=1 Tax=Cloacibacillus sp. An23 TaxID=1965591 RepID=UPI000B3AF7AB|nr:multidrug efflux SMR transporter [Cloacibacillus sp. An23]OUO93547.1 QacE family quaternary ammonium compound efflux SMR transporter [Cloacibacillus sp. An23]